MAEENVILVTFKEESKAYQAASILKQADAEERIGLDEVAVVQRMEDGTLRVKEGDADAFPLGTWTTGLAGAASGGIIGLTLGTLGGPLGLLLGGSYGAMLGSLFDLGAEEEDESVLAKMARTIKTSTTALVAAVTEPAVEVVDGEMEGLGGVVVRRPVADVQAEIAAAEEAARAADEAARRKLREQRRAEVKGKVQQKMEELKAKL